MTELLIVSAIILIVIVAFMMYYSTAHYVVKMAVFPALIAATVFGYTIFVDNMGAPINALPKGDFLYVFHQAGEGGNVIYLWIWTVDRGQRLHSFPYDRETMEELEESKGRSEGGQEYGSFQPNDDGFDYEQADEPTENTEGFVK